MTERVNPVLQYATTGSNRKPVFLSSWEYIYENNNAVKLRVQTHNLITNAELKFPHPNRITTFVLVLYTTDGMLAQFVMQLDPTMYVIYKTEAVSSTGAPDKTYEYVITIQKK